MTKVTAKYNTHMHESGLHTGFLLEVCCSLEAETLTENEVPPLIVHTDYILMLLVPVCSHRGVLIFLQW